MAIDWNKPVETCEDPRHPERVIVLFDASHKPAACKIGSAYHGMPDSEGCIKFGAHTYRLRNVAPKPVKREGWINIWPSSESEENPPVEFDGPYPHKTKEIAEAFAASRGRPVATVRIEWEEAPQ